MPDNSNEAFLERLLATFRVEAQERIQTIAIALVELDNASNADAQRRLIETVFREVHSLKGAARAVDKGDVEALCQALESVFAQLKRGALPCSRPLVDLLLQASDLLERLLSAAPSITAEDLKSMCARLQAASENAPVGESAARVENTARGVSTAQGESPAPTEIGGVNIDRQLTDAAATAAERPPRDNIRIATARIDALLRQAEAMLALKLSATQRHADTGALCGELGVWKKDYADGREQARALEQALAQDRFDAEQHLPALRKLLDIYARTESALRRFDWQISLLHKHGARDAAEAAHMVDALLDEMKQVAMQPFADLFAGLPKLVRDLARDSGKEVDLVLRGGEIEIDRRILDYVRDPIIHLVRNAIDHGIETPARRAQANKSPRARLLVEATQRDGKILLQISDDGAGIDRARVLEAAQRLGKNASLDTHSDDAERVLGLIFESGFSTNTVITDISGRGLGLAIVREKIEALGGAVKVTSESGRGAQFRMTLPLTLATYRGVLVNCAGRQLLFPLAHVERVIQCPRSDIDSVQNRDVINWEGRTLALAQLADLLELPGGIKRERDKWPLVVATLGEQRLAFVVDAVIGEQEVLVKSLGPQLRRVPYTAAAAVLADGHLTLILNMADLFKAVAHGDIRAPAKVGSDVAAPRSILVAEDSITSRQLLRGMLEGAGYRVKVAVDGEDAWAKLHDETFDLLVSDVDMPHLGGFDLTARVRADANLRALPVVLVTSLASSGDRERGIDVGASAYLVKSDFEESNLLEVIRRLIGS